MIFHSIPRLVLLRFLTLIVLGWPAVSVGSLSSISDSEDQVLQDILPSDSVVTLTLQEAVMQALEHNLDIQVSRQTRDIRLTDIVFQHAQFDPTVRLSGRYDRTVNPLNRPIFGFGGVPLGADPAKFDQNETNFSLGLKQKLLTGGDYDLIFNSDRNSVAGSTSFLFNPGYTSNLRFNLTQPLLRNFGPTINKVQITLAQNAADVEQLTLVNQVLLVIAQVEQAYWELVFARENLKVTRATLQAAEELLASNRAKVKAGVMADVEALQAQAGVAIQVEQILLAQKTVSDQEDQLRRLLSNSESNLRQTIPLVPLDPPVRDLQQTPLEDSLQLAFDHRPEILQAKKNIETSTVNTRFAKNQLLPDLSFQGNIGLSGLGKNPGDNFDRLGSTDFYNMGGGLVLSYPLGNRSAESQYQRRMYETQQSQVSLLRVRQQIIIDVKEAIRQVQTSFKRTRTNQTARQLSERQLKAEQERLNLGLSTTRLVLEFQRDLRIARGRELRAILDYNQSLSRLRLVTASTLDHYDIEIQ
jgi:outer membrane protein TolC